MNIKVNDEILEVTDGINISSLLQKLNLENKIVAISLNLNIIKKESWPSTNLKEDDSLELLHFMGGGQK